MPANDERLILDARRVKIRDAESRQVKTRAVYVALGVTRDGEPEVPGLWIADNEEAKFRLSVMNTLRNRGVEDILIAVVPFRDIAAQYPAGQRTGARASLTPSMPRSPTRPSKLAPCTLCAIR